MINKNIIMLSILFCAVAGFTNAPSVYADGTLGATTYNTGTQYFKKEGLGPCTEFHKKITNKDVILGYYTPKHAKNLQNDPNELEICMAYPPDHNRPNYVITKAVVEFRKTVNGQVQKSTKTFQKGTEGWNVDGVLYKPKNDYTPYSAVVYYQKR